MFVHALYFIPECTVKIKFIILCYEIHKNSWLKNKDTTPEFEKKPQYKNKTIVAL